MHGWSTPSSRRFTHPSVPAPLSGHPEQHEAALESPGPAPSMLPACQLNSRTMSAIALHKARFMLYTAAHCVHLSNSTAGKSGPLSGSITACQHLLGLCTSSLKSSWHCSSAARHVDFCIKGKRHTLGTSTGLTWRLQLARWPAPSLQQPTAVRPCFDRPLAGERKCRGRQTRGFEVLL